MRPDRAMCRHCQDRVAKRGRVICDGCYRGGARLSLRAERELTGVFIADRPARLHDTGLRIDDEFAELVLPDGARQFPVPRHIVVECWLEPIAGQPGLLRVLRVGPTKERP